MTLDYKILWIDDREEFFKNHKSYLEEYLEDLGFEANIKTYGSFAEFEEKEKEASHQKVYDLFLIDLNLDHDKTGDELISQIRGNRILTDIIFYSTSLQAVREKVNQNNIEGVYVTSRNQTDFEEKVTDVIDVTIKKVQDVNNLRGLIMAEVAELDRLKEKILLLGAEKIENRHLEKYTLKQIKKSNTKNLNKVEKFTTEIETIEYSMLLKQAGFIDANKKAYATGEILDKLDITEPIGKKEFSKPYIQNILGMRNKFAHIEECDGVDENNNVCKVIGNIPFTAKKCIEIRKEIRTYKKLLEEIYIKVEEA
ncbi:MAG TPA: hypothetical protein EYG85_06595 [Crocinitomix sp.]|nr:hypothetical protein [Crocinitomix sp.]